MNKKTNKSKNNVSTKTHNKLKSVNKILKYMGITIIADVLSRLLFFKITGIK